MRVLVTGASGLLGSRMLQAFPGDWDVTGTCGSREVPGLVQVRLEDRRALRRLIEEGSYDWVVHCAAIRSPDTCARDQGRAMEVNSVATECVALAAENSGARLAYASTDYVFPGDDPPYSEDDRPSPLNVYGHSKLAGEQLALHVPGGLVVRMPALYSVDLEAPNNVLCGLSRSLSEGREVPADDEDVRYYTLAEDVAAAFLFLMREHVRGIVHVSAGNASTKCGFLRAAAEAMGRDPALVVAGQRAPDQAPRPRDSHLDTGRYESLGGPPFRGYPQALQMLSGGCPGPRG